jgi:hypothetical protein
MQPNAIRVRYMEGAYVRVIETNKPPEEVLEAVRSKMFPDTKPPQFDERWARAHAEWSK